MAPVGCVVEGSLESLVLCQVLRRRRLQARVLGRLPEARSVREIQHRRGQRLLHQRVQNVCATQVGQVELTACRAAGLRRCEWCGGTVRTRRQPHLGRAWASVVPCCQILPS